MSLTNFAKALKAKNFNVVDNTLIFEDYNITGPAFGVENCKVYIYNSDDGINEIYIEKSLLQKRPGRKQGEILKPISIKLIQTFKQLTTI